MTELLDRIKENFSRGYFGKVMALEGLPEEYPAWTIKKDNWLGIAVPLENFTEFSENFSKVRIFVKDADIGDNMYHLLILSCDDVSLRNEFASVCLQFVLPGDDGELRKELVRNPEEWWKKWKNLLGNISSVQAPYPVIGELMVLEYLLKHGTDAKWYGAESGSQDIESPDYFYEVKSTTKRYGYEVTVNSIYQLKSSEHPLKLVFCRFEPTSSGVNVDMLVESLTSGGYPKNLLEKSLTQINLEKGCTARKKQYKLLEMKCYEINDDFPVISESSFKGNVIPKNILRINYTVDLSGVPCKNLTETEHE